MRPRRRRSENGENPSDARPEHDARSSTPTSQDGAPGSGDSPNPNNNRPGNRSSQRRGRGSGRERQSNPGNRAPENGSSTMPSGGTSPNGDTPNSGAPNRNSSSSNQAPNPNQDRSRQPGNQRGRGRQGRRRGPNGGRQNRPASEGNAPTNEPQSAVMENNGAPRDPQSTGSAPNGTQPRRDGQGGRGRRQQSGRRQQQGRQQPTNQELARQESGRQDLGRQDSNRQESARQESGRQPAERQNNRNPRRGPGRGQQRRQNPRPALPTERSFSPEDEKPNNRPNRRERAPIERAEAVESSPQGNNRQGQRSRQNNGRSRRPNERSSWSGGERYVSIDRPLPTTPIRTNRGIKARSQRGQFSKNWWARRWIESMEQLVDPGRLQRGRSYARSGQVLSLQETQNGIEAKVQGSRPQPYKVVIQVTPLTNDQWDQVIDALSEQALFTAQLLAGEMPTDIEDAFNTAQVSLFPIRSGDLFTSCSCPDWANPCKHVAATHYILGDRFDDDPFLLFRMRGRSQEEILQALRARRAGQGEAADVIEESEVQPEQALALEDQIEHFWEPAESLDTFPLTIRPASIDMPLLKRMGEPAFLVGDPLETLLKPAYDTFMRSALLAAYSDEEPLESANGNGNGNGNGDSQGHDELE